MIEFKNVKLNIRNLEILNNINFTIPDGACACFVGPKNCGKSALMRILCGVLKNYSGKVLIDGVDIKKKCSKKIEIIHEKRESETDLNVNEYLSFYADIYRWKRKEALETFIDSMLREFAIMSYNIQALIVLI